MENVVALSVEEAGEGVNLDNSCFIQNVLNNIYPSKINSALI